MVLADKKSCVLGLQNAGASYQQIMNKILDPQKKHEVAYIDDILVFKYLGRSFKHRCCIAFF